MKSSLTKFGAFKTETVNTADLKSASFNPYQRTTSGAIAALKAQVGIAGGIINPIHITSDDFIIDGHRRVTVAPEFGITVLKAVVWLDITRADERYGELFLILNEATRKVTPQEKLSVALLGGPASSGTAARRDAVIQMLGADTMAMEKFIDKGTPYQVIQNANSAFAFLKNNGVVTAKDASAVKKQIVEYQLDQGQQQALKLYLTMANGEFLKRPRRPKFSAKRLQACIAEGSDLGMGASDAVPKKQAVSAAAQ